MVKLHIIAENHFATLDIEDGLPGRSEIEEVDRSLLVQHLLRRVVPPRTAELPPELQQIISDQASWAVCYYQTNDDHFLNFYRRNGPAVESLAGHLQSIDTQLGNVQESNRQGLADLRGSVSGAINDHQGATDNGLAEISNAIRGSRYTEESPLPVNHTGQVAVSMERTPTRTDSNQYLWALIRSRCQALGFDKYNEFVSQVMSDYPRYGLQSKKHRSSRYRTGDLAQSGVDSRSGNIYGVQAYDVLRRATELFLQTEAGVYPVRHQSGMPPQTHTHYLDPLNIAETHYNGIAPVNTGPNIKEPEKARELFLKQLADNDGALPYFKRIVDQLRGLDIKPHHECASADCYGIIPGRVNRPLFLELIWSYWNEQGLLSQSMKAVSLRFQNKRRGRRDPLLHMELDPLRQVNNLIWGYVQREGSMLTVARRDYEYRHQYGLLLTGSAAATGQAADVRSAFLEAFHSLLNLCTRFYERDDNTTVISDAFPVLNSLKEVHLILSKGAHNQMGDLPWMARVEMMTEQWILSRPELREFLGRRIMTAYPEPWQAQVDGMRTIQGWGDTSMIHFTNLGQFGEQVLLSIRYGNWNDIHDADVAKNWAKFWRPEIQGYVHAYRAATGVELSANRNQLSTKKVNTAQPAELIKRRRRRTGSRGK